MLETASRWQTGCVPYASRLLVVANNDRCMVHLKGGITIECMYGARHKTSITVPAGVSLGIVRAGTVGCAV